MPIVRHHPALSRRRTSGVGCTWWFARWLLVLVLVFDHLSAPFHHHHHDGVGAQFELAAAHGTFDADGDTHAGGYVRQPVSHAAMAIRIDPSRLSQLAVIDNTDAQVALVSMAQLLGALDGTPPPQWRPDRHRPEFISHRSLPPAGRAPPVHT